jgi:hypothetical protein
MMQLLRFFILGSWLVNALFGAPAKPWQQEEPPLAPDAPRLVVFEGFLRPG